ncbi:hypothetical protein [Deinococcus sp. PESE-13]
MPVTHPEHQETEVMQELEKRHLDIEAEWQSETTKMTDFMQLDAESAAVLRQLLDELSSLRSQEEELTIQIDAWAGIRGALQLAGYAARGFPPKVTEWFTQDDALKQVQVQLARRRDELQASQEVALLSQHLEQKSEEMEQELGSLRALLPMSRQILQAERQAQDLSAKLNVPQGLGKLWGALTGRQSSLQKELEWVTRQLQQTQREFNDLQRKHALRLTAGEVQPRFEQRLTEWNALLTNLQNSLAAKRQQQDKALEELAADEQKWRDAQQWQLTVWQSFEERYSIPKQLSHWLALWRRKDEGKALWEQYQDIVASRQAIQSELEQQWRSWPPEQQHEEAAQEFLAGWEREATELSEPVAVNPAPLLPWSEEPSSFELLAPATLLISSEETITAPLLPWLEAPLTPPPGLLAEQPQHFALPADDVTHLPTSFLPLEFQEHTEPVSEETEAWAAVSSPEPFLQGMPMLTEPQWESVAPDRPIEESLPMFLPPLPELSLILISPLPAEENNESELPNLNGTLPWGATLPDQLNPEELNVVSRQADLLEQASRTALTPEERSRQLAVKVAVATGRQHQVNFIEDRLAGGLSALKAPRLQRQLSVLSEAEIILVEELYAWWPEQTHYGATYRRRNGEWQRVAANISRQTCEQLVGRYQSTPSFEEITQLLEDLHEHLVYRRVAFSYQVQTILDELPDDTDFETWVNWMVACAPPQDGEDWADEIDFQDLMRQRH